MSSLFQIGVVGLGAMGSNLARNCASRKIRTMVFNRTFKKTETFLKTFENDFLSGEKEITNFIQKLEVPRKILLMIPAGSATDAMIETILPHLSPGDILIDGGNAHFSDTRRRESFLNTQNVQFIGMGVSGGEEGALKGPSLMPGGDSSALDAVFPFLEKIAANDFSGGKCVTRFDVGGAGHFVKMTHNGIEYAVMQALAEVFSLLRAGGRDFPEIADIFEKWNSGRLSGFLTELSAQICRTPDNLGEGFLLDKVLDVAEQKGTGRWTVMAAAEFGVATPMISAAVDARIFSAQKVRREKLSEEFSHFRENSPLPKMSPEDLEAALFGVILLAFLEGFWLLSTAGKAQKWKFDFAEIARIWEGGCILRTDILKIFQKSFTENSNAVPLEIPEIFHHLSSSFPSLKKVLNIAVENGIPTPVLGAAFFHFSQMTTARGSASFLQGLRDAFGAHTFRRTDQEGVFHTNTWGTV